MIRSKIESIKEFSGGLVTKANPLALKLNQSGDCLNVHSNIFGVLQKRNGFSKLTADGKAGIGHGMFYYVETEATQKLMQYSGSTLYRQDVTASAWDGTWDTVAVDGGNGTAMAGDYMHFTNYAGLCIMTTESQDVPQRYDFSSTAGSYFDLDYNGEGQSGSGTAPSGKYCVVWKSYVWIANMSATPDRLQRSATALPADWDGTGSGWNDIVTSDDIGITGLVTLKGSLYVFKKWSIHRISYLGGDPLIDIKEVRATVGTASPRSIVKVEIPGEGEVIMFLGTDKQIYTFDGTYQVPISESIQTNNGESSIYMNNINPAVFNTMHGQNYADKHWYVCWVALGSATVPDYCIVYDYFSKSWWGFDNQDFMASAIADDGSTNQRKLYAQGSGQSYLWDDTAQDDGTPVSAYWVSKKMDLGSIPALKKIHQVEINTKKTAVAGDDIDFSYRSDWESSYSTAVALDTVNRNVHIVDVPRVENMIQMKLANDDADSVFEVYRIDLIGEGKGIGR